MTQTSAAWLGPRLDEEQEAVLDLVDGLVASRITRAGDDPDAVARARAVFVEHGLWTVGAAEERGGGGFDLRTALLVLRRLGGAWPALAWASAQAHAAVVLLADAPAHRELWGDIHKGAAVAVVVSDALVRDGSPHTGIILRVDAAAPNPHVVVLPLPGDTDVAYVVAPDQVETMPVRRTGLDGALTAIIRVHSDLREDMAVRGAAVTNARRLLGLAGAAIAGGIAEAAARAAIAYSSERVQFGAPLTALTTVRTGLMRQVTAAQSALLTACETPATSDIDVAAALEHACAVAVDVAAAAVQAHGGYGYMAEYMVEGLLRDAVSLRAATSAFAMSRRTADAFEAGVA